MDFETNERQGWRSILGVTRNGVIWPWLPFPAASVVMVVQFSESSRSEELELWIHPSWVFCLRVFNWRRRELANCIYCPDTSSRFCLGKVLGVVTGDLNPKRKRKFPRGWINRVEGRENQRWKSGFLWSEKGTIEPRFLEMELRWPEAGAWGKVGGCTELNGMWDRSLAWATEGLKG